MTQPAGERCDLCRFEVAGACHFNPPSFVAPSHNVSFVDASHAVTWPTVKPDDWCGHFKAGPIPADIDEVAEAFDQFESEK